MNQPPAAATAVPSWTPADLIKGALGAFLITSLALGITLLLEVLLLPQTPERFVTTTVVVGTFLAETSLFLAAWWFSVRKYRCPWGTLGFRRLPLGPTLSWAIPGLLLGFAINVVYLRLLALANLEYLLPKPPPLPLQEGSVGLVASVLLVSLVAPLAEETFFRGFLFGGLRRYGLGLALLVSSGAFALSHVQPGTIVPVFLLGVLLGLIYHGSGSLWPAILVHLGYNTVVLSVLL